MYSSYYTSEMNKSDLRSYLFFLTKKLEIILSLILRLTINKIFLDNINWYNLDGEF